MRTFIIDNGSSHQKELVSLLAAYKPKVVAYGNLQASDIPNDSFIVLSGGHTIPVLWHNKDFANEIEIIKKHTGPILGICLGAQLIAHVYGAHLHLLAERRRGLFAIRPVSGTSLLDTNNSYTVSESHNWSIRTLRNPLIPLAVSDDGVEIFKHDARRMYGVQFHPELGTEDDGQLIYNGILAELGV